MTDSRFIAAQRRLDEIKAEILALHKEQEEIEAAVAVLSRFDTGHHQAVTHPEAGIMLGGQAQRSSRSPRRDITGPPRPEGIPTISKMVETLLSETEGHRLTSDEIITQVGARWWPGVVKNQVAPQVYRLAKSGRFRQVAKGTFALPRESDSAGSEKPKAEHAHNMFGPQNSNPAHQGA